MLLWSFVGRYAIDELSTFKLFMLYELCLRVSLIPAS